MTLEAGRKAPPFSLQFVQGADPEADAVFDLEERLARGPVFAIFAKRTCPTCQWSLPLLDRLHAWYRQEGASVVLILQDSSDEALEFAEELGLHMPIVVDPEPHSVSEAYGIEYVPTSFWIGSNGTIEEVIEAFAREPFNEVNRWLAQAAGVDARPLFQPEEGVPAFRPG